MNEYKLQEQIDDFVTKFGKIPNTVFTNRKTRQKWLKQITFARQNSQPISSEEEKGLYFSAIPMKINEKLNDDEVMLI